MSTLHPTQIGFTPSGSAYGSTVVIGRDMNASWEAIGFGYGGRPDPTDRIYFNMSQISGVATPLRKAVISFDTQTLLNIISANSNAPTTGFHFAFRELQVCDGGVAKAMTFVSSQPYATA